MDFEHGSLTDINVADLAVGLHLAARTGILRLQQAGIKKSIYFKSGRIVFVHSSVKHERLGEVLLRLGKITEEEFKEVSAELEEGRRLGQLLLQKGILSASEVTQAVSYQLQQILYSVFNWDSGDYEFVERERPVFEDIMVEVSTPALVIDGIRNITNLVVLERAVEADEDRIVLLGPGKHSLPRTNLDFSEETIIAGVDGKKTIRQLRSITRLQPHEFGRALYCLLISGMVHYETLAEITDIDSVLNAKGQPRLHTKPMSPSEYPKGSPAQARRMKTHNEDELRELILATQKRFKDATDEEVLNVLPDFSSDEIQKAYNNLTSIFHPPYFSFDRFRDLKDPLQEIINRMAEAYHNLMQREASQQPLELGIPEDSEESSTESDEEAPRFKTNRMENKITPENEAPPTPDAELLSNQSQASHNIEEDSDEDEDPANTILLRALGKMLQTSGKAIDAEKHLLRALEIEPRNLENHFALVDFYQSQGLKFKAFKHLNMILQLDPKNQKALDSLGVKKRKHLFEISSEDSTQRH
jgi:hypothetical protein